MAGGAIGAILRPKTTLEVEIMKATLRIGDRVADGTLSGTVVANIEAGEFSADYAAVGWAYLRKGVLVMTDEAGLVHYPDPARLTLPK
jgi:hypothetical protein